MLKFGVILFCVYFVTVVLSAPNRDDNDGPQPRHEVAYFPDDNGVPTLALLDGESPHRKIVPERDIKFYLYTKQNPTEPYQLFVDDVENLKKSPFNPKLHTKFIVHGYTNSYLSPVIQDLKDEYLTYFNYNVIGIDWKVLSNAPWYYSATKNTMDVAQYTANLMDNMVFYLGLNLGNLHFLGHSLGAHIAGITGKHVLSGRIARITAFDAALPLYEFAREKWKVTRNDAIFVDSIHTCGGNLGFMDPIGHVDFYPNGGEASQPGCGIDLTGSCSHSRSYFYYVESIIKEYAFPTKECATLKEAKKEKCTVNSEIVPPMGESAFVVEGATGIYHTKTNKQPPFSME